MAPRPKITATYEGVTATRRSMHPYTHVVFGLRSGELEAARVEKDIEYQQREGELQREALAFIERGETPPSDHPLMKVTSSNYYHKFTRWDNVARDSNDGGRTFRTLTLNEARAMVAQYDAWPSIPMLIERAEALRANGERWVAISWHHSFDLAMKGAAQAAAYNDVIKTAIVPVDAGAR